jgi:hypothetical protein
MRPFRRTTRLIAIAGLGALSLTCTDEPTRPSVGQPDQAIAAAAGEPVRIRINRQPPAAALDREVWDPAAQPLVVVKDAANVGVPGLVVTVSIASGAGVLEGAVTATTRANGTALFTDLGIAGTGAHTLRFTTGSLNVTSTSIALSPLPLEATRGKWDPKVSWDIVPLHASLLPTGKVLAWGKFEPDGSMGMPRVWDPVSGPPSAARIVHADDMLFCGGHTLMADGRVMVSGGHLGDDRGLRVTNIFDPASETWASGLPTMAAGRWYPTVTTLPDGRLVTVAGRDANSTVVLIPEIWEGGRWVQLTGASLKFPYYPRQFVAPNGRLFYAGERIRSRWLDYDVVGSAGRGRWSSGTLLDHVWRFNRDYGAAVMYEAGKILYVGGGGDPNWSTSDPKAAAPTETAETIDLNATGPRWSSTGSMQYRRRHLNATVLPDGQVLVTGGTSSPGFNVLSGAVHAAELWSPATGRWTELAGNTVDRAYHSVSLLLPDGTVLHGASGDASVPGSPQPYPRQPNHEIFRPPYFFKGTRPAITGLSKTSVGYGETFTVTTPYAAQITDVRWIRLGSVTHAFDAGQRANTLKFVRGTSNVRVTTPASGRLAPPGHYLLFLLNRNGVPSAGRVVRVG